MQASRTASEVQGPNHHGGGLQGVTGVPEVVPLDAVELSQMVASRVVHPIEVGQATGIEPPA